MKVTNAEIWNAQQVFKEIANQKFPVKVAFAIVKLGVKLSEHYRVIEETRQALIRKYGAEENGQITIKPGSEAMASYLKEFAELLTQETEIDVAPVRLPEKVAATCDKCHHNMERAFEIEPAVLLSLEKFVEVA